MNAKIGKKLLETITLKSTPYEINDDELKGFILRVQPSGVKTYYVRFRFQNGAQNRLKLGTADKLTPVQARDMAKAVLAKVVQGEDPTEEKRKLKSHTLGSFIEQEYEPWVESSRKTGEESIERLENNFKHLFDMPLHEISAWQAEKWRAARLKSGIKPETVNRDLTTLRSALSKAVE